MEEETKADPEPIKIEVIKEELPPVVVSPEYKVSFQSRLFG